MVIECQSNMVAEQAKENAVGASGIVTNPWHRR